MNDDCRYKTFVLTTFGSLGDLHPFLALGLELKRRGHRVRLATSANHQAAVEAAGLAFFPVRPSLSELPELGDETAVMQRILHPRHGPEFLVRTLLLERLKASYEDLYQACLGADVLVSHSLTYAAPLVAEMLQQQGLAWASVMTAPMGFASQKDVPVYAAAPWLRTLSQWAPGVYPFIIKQVQNTTLPWLKPWHGLRRELGLPETKANPIFEGQFSPTLVLAIFSSAIARPQVDWPVNTVQTGFLQYEGCLSELALEGLQQAEAFLKAGEPPIVFTLGSAAVLQAGTFYEESVKAAQLLGKRALLLVGKEALPRLQGVASSAVGVVAYAPYSKVFPQAAAVVHSCGMGTLAAVLSAEKPMVVVPFAAFDQADNTARVERLGLGKALSRKRYTATRAAEALQAVLSQPAYQQAVSVAGQQLQQERSQQLACDALEKL